MSMRIIKRDGSSEEVSFDKVLNRIRKASEGLDVNAPLIAQRTLTRIYDGVKTSELDELAAQLAISLTTTNPDYATLASRIIISNHHKNTPTKFTEVIKILSNQTIAKTGDKVSYISDELINICDKYGDLIDNKLDFERDYLFDYFGFKTLERLQYLLRNAQGKVIERPQHLLMRVSLALWGSVDINRAFETYDLLSQKYFIHATPTNFNAGTPRQQLSSCYLQKIKGDSIAEIYDTLKDCALISKYAGGIGLSIHDIRAKGSLIRGTNGTSNGIVPMLRNFNDTARYVDQCFAHDTYIITNNNTKKKISEINVGDQVLTSGGGEENNEIIGKTFEGSINPCYNKVTKVVTHSYSGKLLTLTTHSNDTVVSVKVTPSHPFLIRSNNIIDYKPLSDIQSDDELVNINKQNNNVEYVKIKSISSEDVENMTLYDLEVENTHDYCVYGLGIAHNGGGKRNGSFAIYLEPWHSDIEDFLKLKLNTGSEEERCRDLFYGLWIPDLFMERVENDQQWTLFCPSEAPGLSDVYGQQFKELYEKYEHENRGKKTVSAQKLWFKILDAQIETGTPYILYKDAANNKSNQKNLGTIKSSNLCVAPETLILTDKGEFTISELAERDEEINVFNGNKWSKVKPVKTGHNQHLITVDVVSGIMQEDGTYKFSSKLLTCTPYHKFILESGEHTLIKDCKRVDAKDLKRGDVLVTWIDNNNNLIESIVWDVHDCERFDDTYCFNEIENRAGVFNGILTGNCTEIIEYTSKDEVAVCNLASIALPTFVNKQTKKFDYDMLRSVVATATRNLNRIIDINYYPISEAKKSNMRHRPIGIGVQGLADVFALMRVPWESEQAANINQRIFEHIYYAALKASSDIAKEEGVYETYEGSPVSKNILQYDMWGVTPLTELDDTLNWDELKEYIKQNGVRNSLLIAPMPTASTSQILGFNEAIEPFTSNIYTRRTLAGEFIIINKYLMKDLQRLGIWNEDMKQQIIIRNGSIQGINEIPETIQRLYKTSWEIKQRTLIDLAAARGAFICQSQSLNLFIADPNYAKLTSMHFYSWTKGLKTGMYYLRTKAPVAAQKFTIDPELQKAAEKSELERQKKEFEKDDGCVMCGS